MMGEEDEILDVNGIAALLKVRKSWVYRSGREYGLPLYRVGGKGLRARKSELMEWFQQQKVYEEV